MALVGREAELRLLRDALDAARSGNGGLVLVTGDAGIGKSTLVTRFAAAARDAGTPVLPGRCLEEIGRPAYQPWRQVVRAVAEQGLGEAPEVFDRPTGPRREAQAGGLAVLDSLVSLLTAAAEGDAGALLVLEDIHLAGRESVLALRHLTGHLAGSRLLVVATSRTTEARLATEIADVLEEIAAAATGLPLGPLDEPEVRELLAGAGLDPELAGSLRRRTAGNPLFVTTAIRVLGSGAADPDEIPAGIRQAVRRQLALAARTADDLPELLGYAAVLGETFSLAALRRVTGTEELLDVLDPALAAGLLRAVPGEPGRFRFHHALVRETVYTDLAPARRAQLHAEAYEALAAAGAEVEELAFHAVHAAVVGKAPQAVTLSETAARRAVGVYAFAAAAGHLRHALAALELVAPYDPGRTAELLTRLSEALGHAGDPAGARAQGLRAAGIAARHGDLTRQAHALLAASAKVPFLDSDDDLRDAITGCADALGDTLSPERARLLARRAYLGGQRDPVALRDQLSTEAVAIARELGDPELLADVLTSRMHALWGHQPPDEGYATATEVLGLVSAPDRLVKAQLWALQHRLAAGQVAEALPHLVEVERLACATGLGLHQLLARSRRATVATLTGDFATAREAMEEANRIGRRSHVPEADAVLWGQRFTLGWHTDLPPDQREWLDERAVEFGATAAYRTFLAARAVLALWRGDRDGAVQRYGEALAGGVAAIPEDKHAPFLLSLLAWLCDALGVPDRAAEVDAALARYDGTCVLAAAAVQWCGTVGHYRGLAARAYGDTATATARFEAARGTYREIGAAPWAVHATRDLARTTGSRRLAGEAEAEAARLGMRPLLPAGPTLTRDGELWLLTGGASALRLRDSLGLRYLAELMRNPGREISAAALAGVPEEAGVDTVLDGTAKAAYRRRIAALRDELAEPGNPRAAGARQELEFLTAELRGALGLSGRDRRLGSETEKARLNVTRAIHAALDRIGRQDAALGAALRESVRTGNRCAYTPSGG